MNTRQEQLNNSTSNRFLEIVERVGNMLPDPAVLFIGTLTAMMLPYSFSFIVLWTIFLLLYAFVGLPLGLQSSYTYPG